MTDGMRDQVGDWCAETETPEERIARLSRRVQEAEKLDKKGEPFSRDVFNNIIAARKLRRQALAEYLEIPLEECFLCVGTCAVSPAGVHVYRKNRAPSRWACSDCVFCTPSDWVIAEV